MSYSSQTFNNDWSLTTASSLRSYIVGLAGAGFVMAFFGAMWWGMGVGGIQGVFPGESVAFIAILALMSISLVGKNPLSGKIAITNGQLRVNVSSRIIQRLL